MSFAVFAGIFTILILSYSLLLPGDKISKSINNFLNKKILLIGFLISLTSVVSSLVYSNVIGYTPCLLCWYARIAFYPQVILFAIALFKKDKKIIDYSIGLTIFGLIIATYHSIIQMVGESPLPCSANGISCATRDVFQYGFITIPFMGFVAFLALLLMLIIAKKNK